MKNILHTGLSGPRHWVGDGFPVSSLFSYHDHAESMSPFLLLDHAGPHSFQPSETRRGVGPHPHRGFETVTIVYQGEVAHHDTTGNGGVIGPGDVQWMTAGSGIVHQEYHSDHFASTGGELEMVQLWVNLPARDKMMDPGYQAIAANDIPEAPLPDDAGSLRVIAGEYGGHAGPARTRTAMQVWDVRLKAGQQTRLLLPDGWGVGLLTLRGPVLVNDSAITRNGEFTVLDRSGTEVVLEANNDAIVLLLSGEPIDEPVVGHGPFVMNTRAEINQAISDYQNGLFGRISQ